MYLRKEVKADIFKKHGGSESNTGSTEGQIALFTHRINHLTQHLKKNHKDYNTERSLVRLVGKRRSLLDYLKKKDIGGLASPFILPNSFWHLNPNLKIGQTQKAAHSFSLVNTTTQPDRPDGGRPNV